MMTMREKPTSTLLPTSESFEERRTERRRSFLALLTLCLAGAGAVAALVGAGYGRGAGLLENLGSLIVHDAGTSALDENAKVKFKVTTKQREGGKAAEEITHSGRPAKLISNTVASAMPVETDLGKGIDAATEETSSEETLNRPTMVRKKKTGEQAPDQSDRTVLKGFSDDGVSSTPEEEPPKTTRTTTVKFVSSLTLGDVVVPERPEQRHTLVASIERGVMEAASKSLNEGETVQSLRVACFVGRPSPGRGRWPCLRQPRPRDGRELTSATYAEVEAFVVRVRDDGDAPPVGVLDIQAALRASSDEGLRGATVDNYTVVGSKVVRDTAVEAA